MEDDLIRTAGFCPSWARKFSQRGITELPVDGGGNGVSPVASILRVKLEEGADRSCHLILTFM